MHFFIFTLILSLSSLNFVQANQGLEIAKMIQSANQGFKGEVSEVEMIIIDAQSREVKRLMEIKTKEMKGDGNRSLIIFIKPGDVKGTKMLTWEHGEKNDDQWLYLPSLKRIKRIHGSNRSGSFMGSEFSYEDLNSGMIVTKYDYQFISKEEGKTWSVELRAKKKSHYSKMLATYSAKYMRPIEIKYYDKRGELKKISSFSDWKKYKVDKKEFWYANKIEMNNVQTKRRSLLITKKRSFKTLRGIDFRKSVLR